MQAIFMENMMEGIRDKGSSGYKHFNKQQLVEHKVSWWTYLKFLLVPNVKLTKEAALANPTTKQVLCLCWGSSEKVWAD